MCFLGDGGVLYTYLVLGNEHVFLQRREGVGSVRIFRVDRKLALKGRAPLPK